jgi:hypothetical protein
MNDGAHRIDPWMRPQAEETMSQQGPPGEWVVLLGTVAAEALTAP